MHKRVRIVSVVIDAADLNDSRANQATQRSQIR